MFLAMILLVVSAIPSVLISENLGRALREWKSNWILLVYFLVSYNVLTDRLRRSLFWVLVASMTLSCIVALIKFSGGLDLLIFRLAPETLRPSGTLHTMTFAGILSMLIVVNIAVFLGGRKTTGLNLWLVPAVLVQVVAILLNATRGAWIALVGGILALPFLLGRRRLTWAAVALLVVAGTFAVRNERTSRRARTLIQNIRDPVDPFVVTRFALWDTSWTLFTRHPVVGVGLGDFSVEADRMLADREVETTTDAHNIFLQVLATRGLLGFIPFVFYWTVLLRSLILTRRRLEAGSFGANFVTGVVAALIVLFIGALSQNNIDDSEVLTCFLFLAGIAQSFGSPSGSVADT